MLHENILFTGNLANVQVNTVAVQWACYFTLIFDLLSINYWRLKQKSNQFSNYTFEKRLCVNPSSINLSSKVEITKKKSKFHMRQAN